MRRKEARKRKAAGQKVKTRAATSKPSLHEPSRAKRAMKDRQVA
jgi:hypothetical protein